MMRRSRTKTRTKVDQERKTGTRGRFVTRADSVSTRSAMRPRKPSPKNRDSPKKDLKDTAQTNICLSQTRCSQSSTAPAVKIQLCGVEGCTAPGTFSLAASPQESIRISHVMSSDKVAVGSRISSATLEASFLCVVGLRIVVLKN